MSLQERVDSIEKRMLFGVQPILTEMLDLVLGRENFIKKTNPNYPPQMHVCGSLITMVVKGVSI